MGWISNGEVPLVRLTVWLFRKRFPTDQAISGLVNFLFLLRTPLPLAVITTIVCLCFLTHGLIFRKTFDWYPGFETWPLICKTGMPKVRFSRSTFFDCFLSDCTLILLILNPIPSVCLKMVCMLEKETAAHNTRENLGFLVGNTRDPRCSELRFFCLTNNLAYLQFCDCVKRLHVFEEVSL